MSDGFIGMINNGDPNLSKNAKDIARGLGDAKVIVPPGLHNFVPDPRAGYFFCAGIVGDEIGSVCGESKNAPIHKESAFGTQADSKSPNAFSMQVGGNHYKDMAIQPTEYIVKNGLNFVEGNVIKYVTRYKLKGGLQDLEKAKHYLEILIQLEKEKNGS